MAAANSGATVSVACKLPNGLHLDIIDPNSKMSVRFATLKGANASRLAGGFGITEGVNKEQFEEWMKRNQALPAVKNELIFALDKTANVVAKAKEMKDIKSLFEGLDPKKMPKGLKKFKEGDDPREMDD